MTSIQMLQALKRNLLRTAARKEQEAAPNDPDAMSPDIREPKKITASFRGTFSARDFAGHVDVTSASEISGWLCRPKNPKEPCTVVISLGELPLISQATNIRRPDIEKMSRVKCRAGFRVDFTSENFRKRLIDAVGEAYGSGEEGESRSLSEVADLTVWAVDEASLTAEGVAAECYLPLPASFKAARPLIDWLDYFDIDIEEVISARGAADVWPPLFPSSESAAGTPKMIAFYLPQFHPTPENDEWWGPGYTEWTSVATAKPNFPDHVAPNIPADLGFYDLRVRDVRKRQGELAQEYGIFGFCYYFYWFSGRRILEKPLEFMLADGEPSLPFCLCWANEPWSRRWDGSEHEVLLEQKHDPDEDLKILDDLMPYFEDPRYIRVGGKPVLVIYRPALMKDIFTFTRRLRVEAVRRGLPGLHLCNAMTFGGGDISSLGFDAAVEFPPHNILTTEVDRSKVEIPPTFQGKVYDYADLVSRQLVAHTNEFPHYPGVIPRWDNTARRPMRGNVFHGATPELFELWLRTAARRSCQINPSAPFVFINSWNEWSEGAHIEPDRRYRRGFLEAIRRVVAGEPRIQSSDDRDAVVPPESSEMARAVASLSLENKLLAERVREMGLLTASPEILPGLPEMAKAMRRVDTGGKCHIDYINGRSTQGTIRVRRRAPLIMRGWLLGSAKDGGRADDFAYFVLTRNGDGTSYYAPVSERESRMDVFDHFKIKTAHPLIGFSARIGIAGLKPGVYAAKFIDVKDGAAFHVDVNDKFEVI